jgi:hypothetical protein
MCCFLTAIVFLGPRFGILMWWLIDPNRWDRAFDSFFWPALGFLFLPWTTLMYVAVSYRGVEGFDWLWIGFATVADVMAYAGGGYGNRERGMAYAGRYR